MNKHTISGLWVGETLPLLARLYIQSFLDHGHEFQLFTCRPYDNIPSGATVRDAREILPEKAVFYHENGSLAPFADWFRNEFLVREGGYWTDLDVACLSDSFPDADTWFCTQEKGLVAVGVIAFPPHHPLMEALRSTAEDPAAAAPWDSPEESAAKQHLAKQVPDVAERRRKAPWGHCGPEGFTHALQHFDMLSQSAPPSRLYPLHYTVWRKCYNGDCRLQSPELKNAWAIHLWGEMLRHEPDAFENASRSSIVGQLLDKHLPGHAELAAPTEKKKVNILVGICSSTSDAQRRKACRETWIKDAPRDTRCVFFTGEPPQNSKKPPYEPDLVQVDSKDGYRDAPQKEAAFFRHALRNYDFAWLYLCDDDTYTRLDRLPQLIGEMRCLSPMPGLVGNYGSSDGYLCGGAGMLLHRSAVETLVEHPEAWPDTTWGDVVLQQACGNLGIPIHISPRLNAYPHPTPAQDPNLITAHRLPPEAMRTIKP